MPVALLTLKKLTKLRLAGCTENHKLRGKIRTIIHLIGPMVLNE